MPPSIAAPDLLYGVGGVERDRQGPHRRDRRRCGARSSRRGRGDHSRQPAAHRAARQELQGRGRASRLAVPAASRRPRSSSAGNRSRWSSAETLRRRGSPRRWSRSTTRREAAQHRFRRRAGRAVSRRSEKRDTFETPKNRGDAEKALTRARRCRSPAIYHLPTEHHNPMEMHASTVVWEGDGKITVYDKTQGSQNVAEATWRTIFGFAKPRTCAWSTPCRRRLRLGPAPAVSASTSRRWRRRC